MTDTPLVSVIIPCYNTGRFLAEAIDSALAQTYRNIEVIVVDDGSTDNSAEIAASYGDRIRYVYQENAGPSAARNTGIRNAKGELIGLLDADDRWLPSKLEIQIPYFLKYDNIGLVFSSYYNISSDGNQISLNYADPKRDYNAHVLLVGNRIGVLTVLMSKSIFKNIGLFDESLPPCEDWDMWIRIAAKYDIFACDAPLAEYRDTPGSLSKDSDLMDRAKILVLKKNRRIHGFCFKCEIAYRQGLSWKARNEGYTALRQGDYRKACKQYVLAIKSQPAILFDSHLRLDLLSLGKRSLISLVSSHSTNQYK